MIPRSRSSTLDAGTPGAGPLCRMVAHENEVLSAHYDRFRDAWDRRDIANAFVAFERFRTALLAHMKWEEEALFAEWKKRCRVDADAAALFHARQHEYAERFSARIEQLLARRMGIGPLIDEELVSSIHELENLLANHRRAELHEVCCRLDALLSDSDVDRLAGALGGH